MKKILILAFFAIFFTSKALAYPYFEDVRLEPQNVLCLEDECDSPSIIAYCMDSEGKDVNVFGSLISPIRMQNNESFQFDGEKWVFKLSPYYFDQKKAYYTFNLYCSNGNETNSTTLTFKVSTLEALIRSFKSPVYLGDNSEIRVNIKKDDEFLTSYTNFILRISQASWNKTVYLSGDEWVIKFDAPKVKGIYDVELIINVSIPSYSSKTISLKKKLEVKEPLELILSLNKREFVPNDLIKITVSAYEKGEAIILSKDYLTFKVGSVLIESEKISLSASGNSFIFEFGMPNLSPGNYDLEIRFNYKNYSLVKREQIGYIIPISGKFLDLNNKGISATIRFLINGIEKKKISTDSSGYYSGSIIPGTYDIEFTFPQSTLTLYSVNLENFEDPIKYYYTQKDVEGIKSAGFFIFETSLPYSYARIVMNYDESKVRNENNLKIFKCKDWNTGSLTCNSGWEEVFGLIDNVKNTVTLETKSLSAYVIGESKSLEIQVSLNKEFYSPEEVVIITGVVRDSEKNLIQNALVNITLAGIISKSVYTDAAGIFSLEFPAPNEGTYNIFLEASKKTYSSANSSLMLNVIRKKDISIVSPDSIRIEQGSEKIFDILLVNTGQTDLYNISIFISGIASNYLEFPQFLNEIKVGEEVKVPIKFKIPENEPPSTSSLTIKVRFNGQEKTQILGFTVLAKSNATVEKPLIPTAKIVLPSFSPELAYILIFGFLLISFSFLLKKIKKRRKERDEVINLLLNIKKEIKKEKIEHPIQAFNLLVEKEREKSL